MFRFALHRQGQYSHVCTRFRGAPCRGSLLVLPHRAGPGYRAMDRNVSPCAHRPKGPLPALGDRILTLGEVR